MNVVRLIPRITDLPRCQAERSSIYYNDTPESDRQCLRHATVLYNGRTLCKRHAQQRALADMLNGCDVLPKECD